MGALLKCARQTLKQGRVPSQELVTWWSSRIMGWIGSSIGDGWFLEYLSPYAWMRGDGNCVLKGGGIREWGSGVANLNTA